MAKVNRVITRDPASDRYDGRDGYQENGPYWKGEWPVAYVTSLMTAEFQRQIKPHVLEIIRRDGFNHVLSGFVIIARVVVGRRNGRITWQDVVVDGQTHAAGAAGENVENIDVCVCYCENLEAAATLFRKANINRCNVDAFELHKAGLVEREPAAVAVEASVRDAGFVLQRSNNRLAEDPLRLGCIGTVYNVYRKAAQQSQPIFTTMLRSMRAIFRDRAGMNDCDWIEGFAEVFAKKNWHHGVPSAARQRLSRLSPAEIRKASDHTIVQFENKRYRRSGYSRVRAVIDTLDLILTTTDDSWKKPEEVPAVRVELSTARATPTVTATTQRSRR